jgi:valyl-tRNA synthetase
MLEPGGFSFYFAGAVVEAFVRLHEKGLIYQGIIIIMGTCSTTKESECA